MKLYDVDQGTAEWWRLRRGIPTASMFHRIITPTGKPSAQARGYMYRLIAERLLGENFDDQAARSAWIEHGGVTEPRAIERFQAKHKVVLHNVSFVTTDDGRLGCSPDCLVAGSLEAVEIKCPAPWTQIGYLLDGPGSDYKPQVQGQLFVGGFKAVHFYSYHARMPECDLLTLRDQPYLDTMAELLEAFCDELDAETERCRDMGDFISASGIGQVALDLPGTAPWRERL